MREDTYKTYIKIPFKTRFEIAEELREIYFKFHPMPKKGFYKSFNSWKEYIKWKEKISDK